MGFFDLGGNVAEPPDKSREYLIDGRVDGGYAKIA